MILRAALYFVAILAAIIALYMIIVLGGMAAYGIAIVRSYAFGLFTIATILIGAPAALIAAIWFARR